MVFLDPLMFGPGSLKHCENRGLVAMNWAVEHPDSSLKAQPTCTSETCPT